ncbi:hypothetical protein K1719_006077 [Acacia pycnantha]|nr:hypothetical protein K1719_006077 [Acacia pycnantha]
MKLADEVKAVGFNPLEIQFGVAMVVKMSISKSQWEAKVDVYRTWGWSEEAWLRAFRKQPHCMLASKDKINAVMSFWFNLLGWSSLFLVEDPRLF